MYTPQPDGSGKAGEYYAVSVCVPQSRIYESVKKLRGMGGSGVLTSRSHTSLTKNRRAERLMTNLGLDVSKYEHLKVM